MSWIEFNHIYHLTQ